MRSRKVAIVTGASSGIGKGCTLVLAREGYDLVISSRDEIRIMDAAKEIQKEAKGKIIFTATDVSKKDDLIKLYDLTIQKFNRVDVLVNNTGGPKPGNYDEITEDDWFYSFNETLLSVVRMTELVLPKMIEQKFGRIINITSASVKEPIPRLLLSNTFRPAIAGYSKSISDLVAKHNITINNIMPGTIHSLRHEQRIADLMRATGKTNEEIVKNMEEQIPMKRIGEPIEIGNVVAFLASKEASYITGSCIRVDGGRMRSV